MTRLTSDELVRLLTQVSTELFQAGQAVLRVLDELPETCTLEGTDGTESLIDSMLVLNDDLTDAITQYENLIAPYLQWASRPEAGSPLAQAGTPLIPEAPPEPPVSPLDEEILRLREAARTREIRLEWQTVREPSAQPASFASIAMSNEYPPEPILESAIPELTPATPNTEAQVEHDEEDEDAPTCPVCEIRYSRGERDCDCCLACQNYPDDCVCCGVCGAPGCGSCCRNCERTAADCNCCPFCETTDRDECPCCRRCGADMTDEDGELGNCPNCETAPAPPTVAAGPVCNICQLEPELCVCPA